MAKFNHLYLLLAMLIFVGIVLFGCADNEKLGNFGESSSSNEDYYCEDDCEESSSSIEDAYSSFDDYSSADGVSSADDGESSSSEEGVSAGGSSSAGNSSAGVSSSGASSSSRASSSSVRSSSSANAGANCAYRTDYCNGIPFSDVITTSMNYVGDGFASVDDSGNEIPSCIFATAISKMGAASAGALVNGKKMKGNWGEEVETCGNTNWNQPLCSEAISNASITKVDGGYYIWIGKWMGIDFVTTGGTPVCGGGGGGTGTLTCTGLAATGITGEAITQPSVRCDGAAVSGTVNWTGAPASWTNPTANTYNVSATASCGGSNKTVSCGSIVVSTPATSDLTCTGMVQTGTAGTAITQPTVRCGNTTLSSGFNFTNAPTWNNPAANTYNVGVSASSGTCAGKTANCGTLTVSQKLTCGTFGGTTAVMSGTSVTPPTVTCGNSNVTSGLTWTNAPDNWSSPTANGNQSKTYSNVSVRATSGNCSGQTATCSGSLTVNPELKCGELYQTITTTQTPAKPAVSCGGVSVTTSITWTPNLNATLAAGTYNNIKAQASCGGSNQVANCSGTTTVTAATVASSSSRASSSSVGGGGGSSYPTLVSGAQGVKSGWASRYWDGCKPSCGWQANQNQGLGGTPIKTCGNDGTSVLSDVNAKNSCESGGTSYTCFNQAPWVEGDVAYAFAASHTNSDCGRCYQVQFTGSANSGSSSPAETLNHIRGKTLIVKVSNIGGDVGGTQFDLMIPGGGLGQFDSFSKQSGVNGSVVTSSERYGGFVTDCQRSNSSLSSLQSCLKGKCDAAFTNSSLKSGCYVYADWFGVVNNPAFLTKEITCPSQFNGKW